MTTLQRSSYSFRRQGSSGRIWDNRISGREIKLSCDLEANGVDHEKIQENRSIHNDIDNRSSRPSVDDTTSVSETEVNSAGRTPSPSRSGNKVHKCAIGAIFGICARPSAS